MNSNNPYLLTLPQLLSAKKKIGSVAAYYDPDKYSLNGFTSTSLMPTEFREQLKRNFRINLTDAELGALVFLFDRDGNNTVDSVEFINEFFKIGKQERNKMNLLHKEEKEQILNKIKKNQETRDNFFLEKAETRTAEKWTDDHEKSAVQKVSRIAFVFDRFKDTGLEEFYECAYLTCREFRELMRKNFNVYLSPEEVSALFHFFDKESKDKLDCKQFLCMFFRMYRETRDQHFRDHCNLTRKQNKSETERKQRADESFEKIVIIKISPPKPEEEESAYEKLRNAAASYRFDSVFGNLQKSFESQAVTPTIFKELIKINFQINLTPGELGAFVKMFEAKNVPTRGLVSCDEFLKTFFRLSLEQRDAIFLKKEAVNCMLEKRLHDVDQKLAAKLIAATYTNVSWPVLPSEEDSRPPSGKHPVTEEEAQPERQGSSRRRNRKPGLAEILSPYRELQQAAAFNKDTSFAEIFPKASTETKNFLHEIEKQEKEIRRMRLERSGSGRRRTASRDKQQS